MLLRWTPMKPRTHIPVLAGLAQALAVAVYVLLFSFTASVVGPMIGMHLNNEIIGATLILMTLSLSVFFCASCVAAYPLYLLIAQKNVRSAALTILWTGVWMALLLAVTVGYTISF